MKGLLPVLVLLAGLVTAQAAGAQEGPARPFSALSRVDPAQTSVVSTADGLDLRLGMSLPVPYRVQMLGVPPRLVMDFRDLDFSPLETGAFEALPQVIAARAGRFQPGWSRLVLELDSFYRIEQVGMDTTSLPDGGARVTVQMARTTETAFLAALSTAPAPHFSVGRPFVRAEQPPPRATLKVMLDPGHGGIDPGAVRDGINEADLVLAFARVLKEVLLRTGEFEVSMTRDDDHFVSLEGRIALAKRAGADVFLSLHADAVAEGIARGVQIFTLAEEASSDAIRLLAQRHDREDLLAGVNLSAHDDEIAGVLMSMARVETRPRIEALARAVEDGLVQAGVMMHKRPRESGAFSVLKAPDLPAVLIEIGFMSSPEELIKLRAPEWRLKAAHGVAAAVSAWAKEDAALRALRRQ
jgi:N-acetylmuramoyl-L-alanine amidase